MLFSIIIITLNEQDNIEFTIKCARNAAKVKNNSLPVYVMVDRKIVLLKMQNNLPIKQSYQKREGIFN